MNKSPLLKLVKVSKNFGSKGLFKKTEEVQVLKEVSFEINKGETVALVGESGSGKSTTARLILGLNEVTSGEIWFKGKNLKLSTKKELKEIKRSMQIVFQDPAGSVNPRMTIWKIIAEPLLNNGYSRKQALHAVEELLEMVGLSKNDILKYPHQFSGGQLQRVGIARAIALKPEFLILDEPTSALDVSIQARVLKLLRNLQKELNLTYLFITHDLNVVQSFAERILVMNKGEIVERGTVDDVFSNPKDEYTKHLLHSNLLIKDSNENEVTTNYHKSNSN